MYVLVYVVGGCRGLEMAGDCMPGRGVRYLFNGILEDVDVGRQQGDMVHAHSLCVRRQQSNLARFRMSISLNAQRCMHRPAARSSSACPGVVVLAPTERVLSIYEVLFFCAYRPSRILTLCSVARHRPPARIALFLPPRKALGVGDADNPSPSDVDGSSNNQQRPARRT